jgi:ATP-dependent helicase/nuclease subunit A
MMPTEPRPLPDESERQQAVRERARNVLVDAGAGTGKTTLVIDRVVETVAPTDAGATPAPLDRLAVITFTRRAAGELRYRLRQKLLEALRDAGAAEPRASLLRLALGAVDTAYIGTIHSFADRLLRLRPVEAEISPSYEIAEDTDELVRAVFDRLVHGAETAQLAQALGGRFAGPVPITEVEETVRTAGAVLRMDSKEYENYTAAGVDLLVEGMINTRDVAYVPELYEPDLAAVRKLAADVATELSAAPASSRGGRWLRHVAARLREAAEADSAAAAFQRVHEAIGKKPDYQKGRDFDGDDAGWDLVQQLQKEWRGQLLVPLDQWMGARIARTRGVVEALYEGVKKERGVLDQLDLLVKLRDLLRDDPAARRQLQRLFDHVFVDEFQDTDPLQCEIIFFLAEDGAAADEWRKVRLRRGSLTVVGDPKQSIYRFRRADIAMYAQAHRLLREQGALVVRLSTNMRSRPALIDFANRHMRRLLGTRPAGSSEAFDAAAGRVFYEPVLADLKIPDAGPAVHVVPFTSDDGERLNVGEGRAIEAEAIARRIRWLVASPFPVRDPETGVERDVRYGDVAVLAHVTTNVPLLLRAFDALGIRYSAHGGTLFLSSPLVRQYLLGLRRVADRSDGVAEAALLRPPFFGLDLLDLVSPRLPANGDAEIAAARARLEEARAIVRELRRDRLTRPPIETAIDLIERTALGRFVATGPNGPQALGTLYQIAFELGRRAAERRLDYDGVTREMRAWVDAPIKLDPPDAEDPDTVRVMTIHQAKGLEFPVVVLWDSFAEEKGRVDGCWRVSRNGDSLALSMQGLSAEMPPGRGLLVLEGTAATAERQRLYYVGVTRARDLLVVPECEVAGPGAKILQTMMKGADPDVIERAETYRRETPPGWALAGESPRPELAPDGALQAKIKGAEMAFREALIVAGAPLAVPTAVTAAAKGDFGAEEDEEDAPRERVRKAQRSRYGPAFGSTVHRAIELALGGARGGVSDWVRCAASEHGLAERLEEAAGDVEQALAAVQAFGGRESQSEYPVCMSAPGGRLLVGFIDLLVARDGEVVVIDFKTDAPPLPGATLGGYPEYRRQLEIYVEALRATGLVEAPVRAGLMFTASGEIFWL